MLKLSQEQLEFLILVDMQDDWHCSYFTIAATNYYENSKNKPFDKIEFDKMIQEVGKLSIDKIAEFQFALNILGNL